MTLTKAECLNFPADVYKSRSLVMQTVLQTYACGIAPETADRIIADYKKLHNIE